MASRKKLIGYKDGQINEICFIIADQPARKDDGEIIKPLAPKQPKTEQDVIEFWDKLTKLIDEYGMSIDRFGEKKAMQQQLFVKWKNNKDE